MAMIPIITHGTNAIVGFPYDLEAVAIAKTIPGRRREPGARYWTIPATEAGLAVRRFIDAGFSVDHARARPRAAAEFDP